MFGLAFPDQDFTKPDIGRQERPIFLNGAAEVATCLIGVASFQQLAPDLIHAAGEELGFGPPFRFRQVGLQRCDAGFRAPRSIFQAE